MKKLLTAFLITAISIFSLMSLAFASDLDGFYVITSNGANEITEGGSYNIELCGENGVKTTYRFYKRNLVPASIKGTKDVYSNGIPLFAYAEFDDSNKITSFTLLQDSLTLEAMQLKGDLNNNGTYDIIDVRLLLQQFINSNSSTEWTQAELDLMDMDGDGKITIIDVRLLLQAFINLPTGSTPEKDYKYTIASISSGDIFESNAFVNTKATLKGGTKVALGANDSTKVFTVTPTLSGDAVNGFDVAITTGTTALAGLTIPANSFGAYNASQGSGDALYVFVAKTVEPEEDLTAMYMAGRDFNDKLSELTDNSLDIIHKIVWSDSKPSAENMQEVNIVSDESSQTPIYAWMEGNSLKLWSKAKDITLNEDCNTMFSALIGISGDFVPLESLNVKSTSNVEIMDGMFSGCGISSMTKLDLTGFDTSNVKRMNGMFSSCGKNEMTTLYLGDKFDTSNVTDMSYMFQSCGYSSLTTLDLGNNFDTSNVTMMEYMFSQCGYEKMTELNLGNKFNTSNTVDMLGMFSDCSNLKTIKTLKSFRTDAYSNYMFKNCTSLVGGNGTTFNSNKINATYAIIDGEGGKPGYFTKNSAIAYYLPGTDFSQKIKSIAAGTDKESYDIDTLITNISWSNSRSF